MNREVLNSMIKHNLLVDINNFCLKHLNMNYDEFKKLPKPSIYCKKHFKENCECLK